MAYTAAYNPTLRQVKGSELTWAENDNNWTDLTTELSNIALEFGSISLTLVSLDSRVSSLEVNQVIIPDGTVDDQRLVWDSGTNSWQAQTILPVISGSTETLRTSASAPNTRMDGSGLQEGDVYYNTLTDLTATYTGGAWVTIGADKANISGDPNQDFAAKQISANNVNSTYASFLETTINRLTMTDKLSLGDMFLLGPSGGGLSVFVDGDSTSSVDFENNGDLTMHNNAAVQGDLSVQGELVVQGVNVLQALVPSELTQAQAEDDTSTVFGQVSGQRLAQAVAVSFTDQEQQIGVGQTWQNVSGLRVVNVSYQNTTGKPIQAHIEGSTAGLVQVSINNSTWITVCLLGAPGSFRTAASIIVPNSYYYRATSTPERWTELR